MKPTRIYTCPTCAGPKPTGRASYCGEGCRPRCIVDDCDAGVTGPTSDLCKLHYSRRREGAPMRRKCEQCGVSIERQPPKTRRCSTHNHCDVPECLRRPAIKGICTKHYAHLQAYGTTHRSCATCGGTINRGPGGSAYCSENCRPVCVHPTCSKLARGDDNVCNYHQSMRRRYGELRPDTWTRNWVCVVCGAAVDRGSGRRKHCSNRCQMLSSLNPGRPTSFTCALCGDVVSLIEATTRDGQFKRSDSTLCNRCKNRPRRYGIRVDEIAQRDGTTCRICDQDVDMKASTTDPFRPSIDHIAPRSLGGTDEPSNLQLAHLWCNQVKNARPNFKI